MNGLDGQRVEVFALTGAQLLDRQLEAIILIALAGIVAQARAELGLDGHVPRRAVAGVGDGDPELGRLVLEHLGFGRGLHDFELEPRPQHPAGGLAAGLEGHGRRVVEGPVGLARLDLQQDNAVGSRWQGAEPPTQVRITDALSLRLAADEAGPEDPAQRQPVRGKHKTGPLGRSFTGRRGFLGRGHGDG